MRCTRCAPHSEPSVYLFLNLYLTLSQSQRLLSAHPCTAAALDHLRSFVHKYPSDERAALTLRTVTAAMQLCQPPPPPLSPDDLDEQCPLAALVLFEDISVPAFASACRSLIDAPDLRSVLPRDALRQEDHCPRDCAKAAWRIVHDSDCLTAYLAALQHASEGADIGGSDASLKGGGDAAAAAAAAESEFELQVEQDSVRPPLSADALVRGLNNALTVCGLAGDTSNPAWSVLPQPAADANLASADLDVADHAQLPVYLLVILSSAMAGIIVSRVWRRWR